MEPNKKIPNWVFWAFSSINTRKGGLILTWVYTGCILACIPFGWIWTGIMIAFAIWYWMAFYWLDRNNAWPAKINKTH